MDAIQINPGDYGYGTYTAESNSKYTDPNYLRAKLGYTARATSVAELSPAFCVEYRQADRVVGDDGGIFANSVTATAWAQSYCRGLEWMVQETVRAGLDMVFALDMVVVPLRLLHLYPEIARNDSISSTTSSMTTMIQWNRWTEYLMDVMFEEVFARFPDTAGIVVRTGETYIFDTPYHVGSSPISGVSDSTEQIDIWVQFLTYLRRTICVKHSRKLFFRTWYSFQGSDPAYYLNVTQRIEPHSNLYFSVKHTAGDFLRQGYFNPILGIGQHAQMVEVQLQREYEGKGAYPLYIFEHVLFHDASSASNRSLADLFPNGRRRTLVRGLWTWSRGGGWWGPYIHGAEFWIDLNIQLLVAWWHGNDTLGTGEHDNNEEAIIVKLFEGVCRDLLLPSHSNQDSTAGSDPDVSLEDISTVCTHMLDVARTSDKAMLYGRYCLESGLSYYGCWAWTRDDRIGGYSQLRAHLDHLKGNQTQISQLLWLRRRSVELWDAASTRYQAHVAPSVRAWNAILDRQIGSSFLYAKSYFCIIEAAWRAVVYGILEDPLQTRRLLHQAIQDYDACWSAYKAFALTIPGFPSIYKGTYWNFPFEDAAPGMDATIDELRKLASGTLSQSEVLHALQDLSWMNIISKEFDSF